MNYLTKLFCCDSVNKLEGLRGLNEKEKLRSMKEPSNSGGSSPKYAINTIKVSTFKSAPSVANQLSRVQRECKKEYKKQSVNILPIKFHQGDDEEPDSFEEESFVEYIINSSRLVVSALLVKF